MSRTKTSGNSVDITCYQIACAADKRDVTAIRRHGGVGGSAIARSAIRRHADQRGGSRRQIAHKNIGDSIGIVRHQIAGVALKHDELSVGGNLTGYMELSLPPPVPFTLVLTKMVVCRRAVAQIDV